MKLKLTLVVGLCLVFCAAKAQFKAPALVSGEPIKNGNTTGYGRLSLPFYNGHNLGFASVGSKEQKDLFLQGTDGHGRGTYLYLYKGLSPEGLPIFAEPIKITVPFEDKGNNRGLIVQDKSGKIYGVWAFGQSLRYAEFNKTTHSFSTLKRINIKGQPRGFSNFGIVPLKDGRLQFFFSVGQEGVFSNGAAFPKKITYNAEGFWPYELRKMGVFGGLANDFETTTVINVEQLTELDQALFTIDGFVKFTIAKDSYILSGTRLGNILFYKLDERKGTLSKRKYAVNKEGIILRNPGVHSSPAYFYDSEQNQGLLTVGEGGLYYYKNSNKIDKNGNLIMEEPKHVLQQKPNVYGGSLVIPSVADWNGDGKLDIIAGNSMGFFFFYKNTGTNQQPIYGDPEPLIADGKVIHVQPGYREDIQGPGEARWGYTSPNVIDWDGDGLLDIITGDSRGKFMVYLNIGTKTNPQLDREHTLYLDGMNMYGTWRTRPGVGKLGDRMAYITLDRDDEFHLYWQLDKYNLEDGGKLKMGDKNIRGNALGGGTVGRAKFEIVDWDGDGVKDLLIGTYGKQSIPDTLTGLPVNMKPKRGSTILFMKNVGTDVKPNFEFPKVLKFKGKNISLGGHEIGGSVAAIGPGENPMNLVVGIETGVFMFYDKKDLTW
ncbi:VCBS repeat-containing protein [uncultured Pedobacter sp.]|uniref:FG-GAP repeat domain-containing protein n=1 Tax=uncultured Pedobacter sp. TaxID=246139 RepID=UPI0026260DBE|nr:VCBS repeat-containing protein [uncultured Pedobacter sp.]